MSVNSSRLNRALEVRSGGSDISSAKSMSNIRGSIMSNGSSMSSSSRRQPTLHDYSYASSISSDSSSSSSKRLFDKGHYFTEKSPKISLTTSTSLEEVSEIDQTTPRVSQIPDFGYSTSPCTPEDEDDQRSFVDNTTIVSPSTPNINRVDYELENAMLSAMIKSADSRDLKQSIHIPGHTNYIINPQILPSTHVNPTMKNRISNGNLVSINGPIPSPMHIVNLGKSPTQSKKMGNIMKKAFRKVVQ